ncbi:MAG: 1-acyl-sn-glycerol-3-phosphate acyltransferase [Pseudomonadota bacterium]|nr:1-acyl-sn-glycerol-3-phosphate acyltransferase [Pseudomonadota bacterium]
MRAIAVSAMTKRWLPAIKFSFDPKPLYRTLIHGLTRKIYRPRYIGFENIPATGPVVLISNHVSYIDGPLIDAGCNRIVRYLIDEDIYNLPGVHYIMKLGRAIPIAPNRKSVEAAFDEISAGLRAGDAICIFPEGFLTFTGSLGRFRPGIEWIIRRDAVPVVPIAICGMWGSVFSRKYMKAALRWWPRQWRGRRVDVICGAPIPPEKVNVNYLQEIVLRLKYSVGNA